MKVWIARQLDFDGHGIIGVFESADDAAMAAREAFSDFGFRGYGYDVIEYSIMPFGARLPRTQSAGDSFVGLSFQEPTQIVEIEPLR